MAPRRFEDVEIGDDLPEVEPDIGMENVRRFARAAGMYRDRFIDHEGARKQGLPGAIVPGIMSQALLAAMIHRWAPGSQIEKIDTVFRAPVLVDSRAVCRGVVTETDPGNRTVHIDLEVRNEAGETRIFGTASVRL